MLKEVERTTNLAVHHTEGDQQEQVGHLTDGHAFRAVTYNAEDGKQSQSHSCTNALVAAKKEIDKGKDADTHQNERKVIVAPTPLGIIEIVYNDPHKEGVEGRTDEQVQQIDVFGKESCKYFHNGSDACWSKKRERWKRWV